MKKILVEVNECYLESCRKHMESMWGMKVSNSELVGHLLFLHHDIGVKNCQLCRIKYVESEKDKLDKRFKGTPSAEPRKPLRSLMDAYKETKK